MEVIKRINSRLAWIQVDDTEAQLVSFDKDTTATNMEKKGDEIKAKRDRIKQLKQQIAEIKQRRGI